MEWVSCLCEVGRWLQMRWNGWFLHFWEKKVHSTSSESFRFSLACLWLYLCLWYDALAWHLFLRSIFVYLLSKLSSLMLNYYIRDDFRCSNTSFDSDEHNRNHHKPYHTHSMSFFAFSFMYAFFMYTCLTYITEIFMQSIYILEYTHILLWWPAKFELKGIINNILYRTISLVYFVMENVQLSIHFGWFDWGFWCFRWIVWLLMV